MALMRKELVISVFLCACLRGVWCYSSGAPPTSSACSEMLPGHQVEPQPRSSTSTSPWDVKTNSVDYTVDQIITVEIAAKPSFGAALPFKGFLVQARAIDTGLPVGKFIPPANDGAHVLTCSNVNDSITHSDATVKLPSYILEWQAPPSLVGDIEFLATIVYSKAIFWIQINSSVVTAVSDPCDPNPCLNGGTCFKHSDGRSYYCGCVDSTNQNRHCEVTVSPMCSINHCLHGGFCQESVDGSFVCFCPSDRYGTICENVIIGCDTNPCKNGATCTDHSTGHICECPAGFTGLDCDTASSNPCGLINCLNGGTCFQNQLGRTICSCPSAYTGQSCETIILVQPCLLPEPPCKNGGVCFASGSGSDAYVCNCLTGYTGVHCEDSAASLCESNPCANGGTCQLDENSYTCSCLPNYIGNNCEMRGPCFGVSSCSNRGTCVPAQDGTSHTCSCQTEYNGDNCEYTNFCELNNQCQEGSTCVYTGQNSFNCECPPGFGGTFCENDLSCVGTPCRNGGTCNMVGDGTHTCTCGPTHSGINCEIYTNPCSPNPCVNGVCRVDFQSPNGRKCNCDENYMGVICTMYIGDPCSVFTCNNGGTCINNNQLATCVCPEDYSGINCEIALNVPPVFNGCPSGVTLTVPMTTGTKAAYIDLIITATDRESTLLNVVTVGNPGVTFPTTITFTEEYREGKRFTLQATDSFGGSSQCLFTIQIIDNENPVVTCPDDISDITTGDSKPVRWLPATATDNLGLASENTIEYTPLNGSSFLASTQGMRSTVLVKARDTFDNIGECQFSVTIYKKEQDCAAFSPPDNGQANCIVDGAERRCSVECNPGFGNAVGSSMYECNYGGGTATWDPRPNSNVCVSLKPGNGVNKVVTIAFPVDSSQCNSADLAMSRLKDTLTSLGVCNSNETPCKLAMNCGDGSGSRRKRAPVDLTADITITGTVSDEDTTTDVKEKLDTAVDAATAAAGSGSLTVELDGETINNNASAIGVSDYTWECKAGQISGPDGCLSCPPGTFHDTANNRCNYCELNTYQNKAEQDSCTKCPKETPGNKQIGAYREDYCGEKQEISTGPWTPTLIAVVGAAGGLIVLLVVILCCVFIVKASRSPSKRDDSKRNDGPLSNFSHLNHAYKEDDEEPEMQFHGGISATSDTTYQNMGNDAMDTASTDHLVRIPSLSQYSDYYATLNARSAPVFDDDPVPSTPPPPPPVSAPQAPPPPPELNSNNSNTAKIVRANGSIMNGGSKAKFQV